MKGRIERGDIVLIKSINQRGKVKKLHLSNFTALVEVIIAFDKMRGIRSTKLERVDLKDLERIERKPKKMRIRNEEVSM